MAQEPDGTTPRDPDHLPVLTVLAVHGIGTQKEGQTANLVAEALLAACSREGIAYQEIPVPADTGYRVERAMIVDLVDAGPIVLEFVDGWWDEHVTAPPARTVAFWALRVAPLALFSAVGGWLMDLTYVDELRGRKKLLPMDFLGMIGILALPLVALSALMTLSIWTSAQRLRPGSFPRVTRVLEHVLGDAWLYRSDLLDDEVLPDMRSILDKAARRTNGAMLIGHSQGAEITRRLMGAESVLGCVWIGGAELPLTVVRTLRRSPWLPVAMWGYLGASYACISVVIAVTVSWVGETVAGIVRTIPTVATANPEVVLSLWEETLSTMLAASVRELTMVPVYIVVLIVWTILLRATARHPADTLERHEKASVMVKSLLDPVSAGIMRESTTVRFVPARDWRDHVTYFDRPETGTALLEALSPASVQTPPHVPSLRFGPFVASLACFVATVAVCTPVGLAVLGALPDQVSGFLLP